MLLPVPENHDLGVILKYVNIGFMLITLYIVKDSKHLPIEKA